MFTAAEGLMSVREAAHLLGVTEKQVQHLGRRGEVHYVARGLLDGASVRQLHAVRQGSHTRGWSSRTAWAAIALLSGRDAGWLGQGQMSRLRTRLREINAARLVAATRNRALVDRFAGHSSATERLSAESCTINRRALRGLASRSPDVAGDFYLDVRDQGRLVRTYSLRPHARGNIALRALITDDVADDDGITLNLVRSLMQDADVLPALDAATSEDPRERGVAFQILDDALSRFGQGG